MIASERVFTALDKIIEKCGGPGSGVPGPCPAFASQIPNIPNTHVRADVAAKGFISKYYPDLTANQLAAACGAISGAYARMSLSSTRDHIEVEIKHEDYTATRLIYPDKHIHNDVISVNNEGRGVGTRVFSSQVRSASELGFNRIEATAAQRSGVFNGAYTWARLGYDGPIHPDTLDKLKNDKDAPDWLKKNVTTIHQLMTKPGGREWWINNSSSFEGTFDLKEGSKSRLLLDYYVEEKARKAASRESAGAKSGGRGSIGLGLGSIDRRGRSKERITSSLLKVSTQALRLKILHQVKTQSRATSREVYRKQQDALEKSIEQKLALMFKDQTDQAIAKLKDINKNGHPRSYDAAWLLSNIFNPLDWNEELINRALPPIAKAMAESMMAQVHLLNGEIKVRKSLGLKCGGPGSGVPGPCPIGDHSKPNHLQHEWADGGEGLKAVKLDKKSKDAVAAYQLNSFAINHALRNSVGKAPESVQVAVIRLQNVMRDHGVVLKKDTVFYRGVDLEEIKGKQYQEPAFTSTTIKAESAAFFGTHVMRITVPAGTKVLPILSGKEGEVILPRDLNFTIGDEIGKVNRRDYQASVIDVKVSGGRKSSVIEVKASTASEWLNDLDPDDLEDLDFGDVVYETPYGNVSMRMATEFPQWMKDKIEERLQETFSQSYWEDINKTTGGDIDEVLQRGIRDGLSIENMAKEMEQKFGSAYPRNRGRLIARTESGNALNGARSDAIDGLIEELGMEEQIKKIWLSVLGNTTRDTHAYLDGVPAGTDGCWALGGVRARWPGDVRLPAGERCNCMCSIFTQFGLSDESAAELIGDSIVRQQAKDFYIKNCGTGSGGFKPGNTCSKGGGAGHEKDSSGKFIPGTVGKISGVDTSKWTKDGPTPQWAMKKIAKLEELALAGKWNEIATVPYPKQNLEKYTKGVTQALQNLNKMHGEDLQKLPPAAKPIEANPNVASDQGWKKIGEKLGTEKGGVYEMGGKKYYVKIPDNPDRARNEVLADKLYELAGGSVVKSHLVEIDGKVAIATEWEESTKVDFGLKGAKVEAARDYALHVWLNNRDAVGAGSENPMDNIRLSDKTGKLTLVDAGGSLDYSGMGGSGKKPFTKDPAEWAAFRDPSVNPSMAKVFGDMTPEQLIESTKKLYNVSNNQISDLVQKYGNGLVADKAVMVETLIARRDWIVKTGAAWEAGVAAHSQAPHLKPVTDSHNKDPLATFIEGYKKTSPMAVPPPPASIKFVGSFKKKIESIYDAAKTGDVAKVQAIDVNAGSTNFHTKKILEYKNQVLMALGSGGKISSDHVIPKIAPEPALKKPVKIEPNQFPAPPQFITKNEVAKAANNEAVKIALGHAEKGDLVALQGMQLPPSPKLKAWHSELAGNLANQLNPPPKPTSIKGDYSKHAEHLNAKKMVGIKKVGYWSVLGEVSGVPNGIPEGTWISEGTSEMWHEGHLAYNHSGAKTALKHYTGGGYGPMNDSLRSNNPTKEALSVAQAIMDHGVELPIGQKLRRHHGGVSANEWDGVQPGQVISEKAILSTSTSKPSGKPYNTMLEVLIGPGVKGMPAKNFSNYTSENEVMLPPNTRILVTHVQKHSPTSTTVHGILLPTQKDQCCPP